jgi:hypothetical protein
MQDRKERTESEAASSGNGVPFSPLRLSEHFGTTRLRNALRDLSSGIERLSRVVKTWIHLLQPVLVSLSKCHQLSRSHVRRYSKKKASCFLNVQVGGKGRSRGKKKGGGQERKDFSTTAIEAGENASGQKQQSSRGGRADWEKNKRGIKELASDGLHTNTTKAKK